MSIAVVTNGNDAGAGSLRAAIQLANTMWNPASVGVNVIKFAVGAGWANITLATPLPVITANLMLDGMSQPGLPAGQPHVKIDCSAVAVPVGTDKVFSFGGLQFSGTNQICRGIALGGSQGTGFLFKNTLRATLQTCWAGLDIDGTTKFGNIGPGVVYVGGQDMLVGGQFEGAGCVLSGSGDATNQYAGFLGSGGAGVQFYRNKVGTNAQGNLAVANQSSGIKIDSTSGIVIGSIYREDRNQVSGNVLYGIELSHPYSNGATILNNYIGTDATGLVAVPNQRTGVILFNCGYCFVEFNVIGGNLRNAINMDGSTPGNGASNGWSSKGYCRGNYIARNWIGVGVDGSTPLGNGKSGVLFTQCQNNVVEFNYICNGLQDGVFVLGQNTTTGDPSFDLVRPANNELRGNYIGQNPNGGVAGNARHGVFIQYGSTTLIGDSFLFNAQNVIKNNRGYSVTARGYGWDTNVIVPNGNIFLNNVDGNGNNRDTPFLGPYSASDPDTGDPSAGVS